MLWTGKGEKRRHSDATVGRIGSGVMCARGGIVG